MRLTEITFSQTFEASSRKGFSFYACVIDHHVEAAELLTVCWIRRFTPSGSETSACTEMALPPPLLYLLDRFLTLFGVASVVDGHRGPSRPKASAIALPIPREEPVTAATLFSSCISNLIG